MNWEGIKDFLSFEFSDEFDCVRNCFYGTDLVAAYRFVGNGKYLLTLYFPDIPDCLYRYHYSLGDVIDEVAIHVCDLVEVGKLPVLEE